MICIRILLEEQNQSWKCGKVQVHIIVTHPAQQSYGRTDERALRTAPWTVLCHCTLHRNTLVTLNQFRVMPLPSLLKLSLIIGSFTFSFISLKSFTLAFLPMQYQNELFNSFIFYSVFFLPIFVYCGCDEKKMYAPKMAIKNNSCFNYDILRCCYYYSLVKRKTSFAWLHLILCLQIIYTHAHNDINSIKNDHNHDVYH